jgi:large subunit ribosomal protein L22
MVIMHISANPGRSYESYFRRARGRSTPKRRESVNVEVIIRETKEKEE